MFDIVKKLIMARQITMEKGEIRLLNQRMIMAPAITFYYLQNAFPDNELANKTLYYAAKLTNSDGYSKALFEQFGLKADKLFQWMTNSAQLAGWGEFDIVNLDIKGRRAVVHVRNSAIVEWFKHNNSKYTVDHIVRGYMAGAGNIIFGDEMDIVETKCAALGDPYCEFVAKRTKDFDFNSDVVASQLDKSGEIEKKLKAIAWRKKQ